MKKIILNLSAYIYVLALGAKHAIAQTGIENPLGPSTFEELLNTITSFLFLLSIPIVSIMILYGGFKMLTAAGAPDKIEAGKKTITYAIVGFIVIIISRGAALLIKDILGV